MKTHELVYDLTTVNDVAEDLAEIIPLVSVMTFTGTLGAGKTTLISALLKQFDIHDVVQSPTFTYLNTYTNTQGQTFYHFDLYRLKSVEDFRMAGFDEYLYQPQSWTLIEWPEIIMPLLTQKVCHCSIDYYGTGETRVLRYFIKN